MKHCPTCGTTYTDESLRYCLSDGATLVGGDEQATVVRSAGDQMRVQIPQDSVQQSNFQSYPQPPASSSGGGLKIVIAVLAVVLLLFIVGGAAGLIYFVTSGKDTPANVGSPTPKNSGSPAPSNSTPTPSPAPSDQTDDLKKQIANLEKQINDQKNTNRPSTNSPQTNPNKIGTTARVNSPGDGFLALRSLPSSDVGDRILQIPHGAVISVGGCLGTQRSPGKRTGRWCRASYNGYSGWVYDAYLIF